MAEKGLFGFCLLVVCFLLRPGLAQVPEPAQCLVSRIDSLTQLPQSKDDQSCYHDCIVEPDCHMVVVTQPVSGPSQCLLVNCLNQGQHSYPRDPSAKIRVYPKSTLDNEQRVSLYTSLRAVDDETVLCYRPMEHGQPPPIPFTDVSDEYDASIHNKIFYNVSSSRCEGFHFRGSASNGNIFDTVDECERLCAGVKDLTATAPTEGTAPTTGPPAVDSDTTVAAPSDGTDVAAPVTTSIPVVFISVFLIIAVIAVIVTQCGRLFLGPSSHRYRKLFDPAQYPLK